MDYHVVESWPVRRQKLIPDKGMLEIIVDKLNKIIKKDGKCFLYDQKQVLKTYLAKHGKV